MKQTSQYMASLYDQCVNLSDDELLSMANNIDDTIGSLLFYSFKNCVSYDTIDKLEARHGRIVPVSRSGFYRKRRLYINGIKQHLADTVASA